jgi:glutamyl-tRNA synthetase
MKVERDAGIESKNRTNTVEENLKRWNEMISGTPDGVKWCIRAKMNMKDKVKCLRDPVFYRCNLTPHHRTGDKYKVYPTYDFACPIVDSIEGVTHAMRTIEYRDRNATYKWVLEKTGVRPVEIQDFSRLSLVNTVLSKRKLQFFVDKGIVDG